MLASRARYCPHHSLDSVSPKELHFQVYAALLSQLFVSELKERIAALNSHLITEVLNTPLFANTRTRSEFFCVFVGELLGSSNSMAVVV